MTASSFRANTGSTAMSARLARSASSTLPARVGFAPRVEIPATGRHHAAETERLERGRALPGFAPALSEGLTRRAPESAAPWIASRPTSHLAPGRAIPRPAGRPAIGFAVVGHGPVVGAV